MKTFSRREWLNPNDSPSTGSVVAYHGPANWGKKGTEPNTQSFFEVADCNVKARLHISTFDKQEDFIKKIETLGHMAIEFAEFLKRNEKDQSE